MGFERRVDPRELHPDDAAADYDEAFELRDGFEHVVGGENPILPDARDGRLRRGRSRCDDEVVCGDFGYGAVGLGNRDAVKPCNRRRSPHERDAIGCNEGFDAVSKRFAHFGGAHAECVEIDGS